MITDFSNKQVAVLGFGIEGKSVVDFLLLEKATVTVFVEKKEGVEEIEGIEGVEIVYGPFGDFSDFDFIIRSPGIRPDKIQTGTATITTSTKIFFERCPCPIIGVTGTKGKGTTSTLVYEMVKKDGKTAFLGGNIGIPPLSFLSKLTKESVVVLELSSFQLMDCPYSPHIAVVLMIAPEHQDWHLSIEEYIEAKSQIFLHQGTTDTTILSLDYPYCRSLIGKVPGKLLSVSTLPHEHPGVFVSERESFIYQTQTKKQRIFSTKKLLLPGKHNWENAAAAIAAAKAFGVKTASIQHVLESFAGLPYRLEKIAVVGGVTYYNDSFATTPETTIAAINAFENPKILILGGSTKHADFSELGKCIERSSSIRAIVGIGIEWTEIKKSINEAALQRIKIIENCTNMQQIIEAAKNEAQSGDIVLLSPACASFGMFKNYKDRGNQFKQEVLKLS